VTVVRRITAADGALLCEMRLRALQDAPYAFESTYAAEVDRPPQQWDAQADRRAAGGDDVTFFAIDGEACVGLVGGYRHPPEHHVDAELVSMWVAPSHRGTDVATRLVDALLDWADHEADSTTVGLWVTRGNAAAQRLYERMGFVETGEVKPLVSDPDKDELRMVFGLRAPSTTAD
jgi:RimJ/RimL family protein N-acetyltransferase